MDSARLLATATLALVVAAACSGGGHRTLRATRVGSAATGSVPVVAAAPAPTAAAPPPSAVPLTPAPTATTVPTFSYSVTTVTAADLPWSWRPGCPVAPASLREIHLSYWGFDGKAHAGAIVVNQAVVGQVTDVFRTLFGARFPLAEVVPVDAYHGSDNAAAASDDTSGFNCRDAVAPGPPQWSVHAYGEAIDVNDVQNPYVDGSTIIPPAGSAYLDRADVRPGMAEPNGTLVEAFAAVGWKWGGRWSPGTDYQHFSLTGG